MKNIIEICAEFGFEVPEDKKADFLKAVNGEYKTIADYNKQVQKLEGERDTEKTRADNAEEAMKGFEGKTPEQIQSELQQYKDRAEQAENDAKKQIEERDFNDALTAGLEKVQFSSEYAKRAVMAEIKNSKLTMREGKILGLEDCLKQIKEADPTAFVDEEEEARKNGKAKFTTGGKVPAPGTKLSPYELMKLKNAHPEIDIKQYM